MVFVPVHSSMYRVCEVLAEIQVQCKILIFISKLLMFIYFNVRASTLSNIIYFQQFSVFVLEICTARLEIFIMQNIFKNSKIQNNHTIFYELFMYYQKSWIIFDF